MSKKVLYLGDTAADQAACYLMGIMAHSGIEYDYYPSDVKFEASMLNEDIAVIIISDYPSFNFTSDQLAMISRQVAKGMGLIMIGGWESYVGMAGGYHKTILKDVLPVVMKDGDDRINNSSPCLIIKNTDHEIIDSLPFDQDAPTVGGFNDVQAKEGAQVILCAQNFQAVKIGNEYAFEKKSLHPLLILGQYELGRVAAYASDVAPHWVGGFVDWGMPRVSAKGQDSVDIEVGYYYTAMFANLVKWAGSL